MSGHGGFQPPVDGFELLRRAIDYALVASRPVTPATLSRPTPCRDWDLRALLWHLNDSLAVLRAAMAAGRVGPGEPAAPEPSGPDLVSTFRRLARQLRGAGRRRPVLVTDLPLPADVVAITGAVEIAVHGWDIGQACGAGPPIPATLAADLLTVCPIVVPDRESLFAPEVGVAPSAAPGDRLVAFLGRHPPVASLLS